MAWVLVTCCGSAHSEWAGVRVEPVAGRPALTLNHQPIPPFAYLSYLGREPYYQQATDAGIHLYCFPAYLGDRGINPRSGIGPFRKPIWTGVDTYDFSSIEEDFNTILKADPEALVIVRIHLDVPAWWEQAHPEECCQLSDGSTFRQSFSSIRWRQEAGAVLEACIKWIDRSPYARHLAGIHVAAGHTEEWFYHFHDLFEDLNPTRLDAFRAWLQTAYDGDVARLCEAWHDPGASFDVAQPADISGKDRAESWRQADMSQHLIDSFRFHAQTMADAIAHFCRVVKHTGGEGLLTGAFYGYHNFVNDPRMGHFALGHLLACSDLDYLSSPNVYHRVMGEDWPPMAAIASVALHGKLWLAENDTRTSITTLLKDQAPAICPPGWYDGGVWVGPDSLDDSVALLRKNTARMLAGGYGGWWFDMWGGWFSHPKLMAVLERTQELGMIDLARQVPGMEPRIAVFADEELAFLDASYGALAETIFSNRYPLGRSGAPYDLYLYSDLQRVVPGPYRVVWLLGPAKMSAENKTLIDTACNNGMTILWTHPDGAELWFPGTPGKTLPGKHQWTPDELRALWKQAGVHLYTDKDDVLNAGNGWVALHTIAGGPRTVYLPFQARVDDAFGNRPIAEAATQVDLDLPPCSTTLLQITPIHQNP